MASNCSPRKQRCVPGRFRVVGGCSIYCWTCWGRILSIFYVLYKVNNVIAASFRSVDCLEALFGGCVSNQTLHCCEKKKKKREMRGNVACFSRCDGSEVCLIFRCICSFAASPPFRFLIPHSLAPCLRLCRACFCFDCFFILSFVQDIWWDEHSWNVFSLIICLSAIIMLFSLYK